MFELGEVFEVEEVEPVMVVGEVVDTLEEAMDDEEEDRIIIEPIK